MSLFRTSSRTLELLRWETGNINRYLATLNAGIPGRAILDDSHEFIRVMNFPLPGAYAPSVVHLVIIVADFPATPPYGLYMRNRDRAQLDKITKLFGRWHVQQHFTPESIPGYGWICYYYKGGAWQYRPDDPVSGDNLAKFLCSFSAALEAGVR